jgi:hypothetical protein
MQAMKYGRKTFSFAEGETVLTGMRVTEKALSGEDEVSFTRRLLEKYKGRRGTLEVVFKNGHPDYAIVTFIQ